MLNINWALHTTLIMPGLKSHTLSSRELQLGLRRGCIKTIEFYYFHPKKTLCIMMVHPFYLIALKIKAWGSMFLICSGIQNSTGAAALRLARPFFGTTTFTYSIHLIAPTTFTYSMDGVGCREKTLVPRRKASREAERELGEKSLDTIYSWAAL